MHTVDDLRVIGGRADDGQGPPITRHESMALIEASHDFCDVVVADLGPLTQIEGGLVREFDTLILVGAGNPVGVARLIKTADRVSAVSPGQSVLAAVNMTRPRSGYEAAEVLGELGKALPSLPVITLPFDKKLAQSAWDGTAQSGSRYAVAVRSMAEVVVRSLS